MDDNLDSLITFGAECKALGNGRVGGFLVVYGDAKATDLAGDYFTADTDFDLARGGSTSIYYDHGFDPTLKARKLGQGTLEARDAGVWVEAQLDLRDEYERAVYAMAEKGALGWSSGTASHLVEREDAPGGKAHRITRWPLGLDASLTPTPCEPRTHALPLKSYALKRKASSLLGEGLDARMASACLQTLQDALWWRVTDVLYPVEDGKTPDLDDLKGAFNEYRDRALDILQGLRDKSAKTLDSLRAGMSLDAHTLAVRAAVEDYANRVEGLAALRATQGRQLSAERRAQVRSLAERLSAVAGEGDTADAPAVPDADRLALETETLLTGIELAVAAG